MATVKWPPNGPPGKERVKDYWVTVKIGLNGLDLDLDRNKHRINLE
jgi:hypothetical protein